MVPRQGWPRRPALIGLRAQPGARGNIRSGELRERQLEAVDEHPLNKGFQFSQPVVSPLSAQLAAAGRESDAPLPNRFCCRLMAS